MLGSHFGSQIIVIHIEVVHHTLKGVSAKAQEIWIKKIAAAVIDGIILLGMLVTLSLVAHEIDGCRCSLFFASHSYTCCDLGIYYLVSAAQSWHFV